MKTFTVQCPDSLAEDLDRLAQEGWTGGPGEVVLEAIRRFVDSHRPELIESQILTDVEWGLHGQD
jgi:hypothetical protein